MTDVTLLLRIFVAFVRVGAVAFGGAYAAIPLVEQEVVTNEGFMTYRGSEFYDAAYYMGMYMPLTTTDTVTLGVTAKQSFVSMEAYKYHKPNCVFKLNFQAA